MKIRFFWIAALAVAGFVLEPVSSARAQEKDEVPARATWRPQAPERPELPPGVERQKDEFKVERPEINLPGADSGEPEGEAERPASLEALPSGVNATSDAARPEPEPTAPAPAEERQPPPDPEPEPMREASVSRPERPAAVDASPAERTPPAPMPGTVVQPEYPRQALLSGDEGYVTLEFTVTREGDVANVAITDARPEGVFEDAVRQAIRRWEFQPATENGQPVDQRVRHRFEFNLDE